jgi:ferritin-like metal-binding protein YciE
MPTIDSLETMVIEELKDLYDAEKRILKALPKMIKKSTSPELKEALESHRGETEEQVARLERAFEYFDTPAKGKACAGMRGIIEEGEEHMGEDYDDDDLRDATIIGSAQRVEHYEIAAYGTAIAHARLLEQDEVVSLLEETLNEEKAADEKLTEIAETVVNLEAAEGEEGEDEGEDAQPAMSAGGRSRSGGQTSNRRSASARGGRR